jgi:hypothetical protein
MNYYRLYYDSGIITKKRQKVDSIIIYEDGSQFWNKNNKLHRISGPATIYNNNLKFWYWNNQLIITTN